mgnify:CR=1 FL=1
MVAPRVGLRFSPEQSKETAAKRVLALALLPYLRETEPTARATARQLATLDPVPDRHD